MISVQEATSIILETARSFGVENLPLQAAAGRVLSEEILADRDFPPFDRVTMDGIAIRFEAFEKSRRIFQIEGVQAAGAPKLFLEKPENCLEAMTGAILPENTDTVIRYEDLQIEHGLAKIFIEKIAKGQNIHRQGSDRREGDVIVPAGRLLSPAEIGVAATVGKTELLVARLPKVAVISTGDELVEVYETPLPHQIRKSNAYALAAAISQWGIPADLLHFKDEKTEVENGLRRCLDEYDVLLLSGGVSAGKLDFVPDALAALGVEKLFHQVAQRPGKPFWFGKNAAGKVVFAFPGNPVSTFLGVYRYFRPWLRTGLGLPSFDQWLAVLAADFSFKPNLTYFLQVKISFEKNGSISATPAMGGGSGDLANLVEADGFLELPADRDLFHKGEIFPLHPYRLE